MRAGVAGIVAILALVASGCGDDDAEPTPPETAATETGGAAQGGEPGLRKIRDFEMPVYVAQPPGSEDLYVV